MANWFHGGSSALLDPPTPPTNRPRAAARLDRLPPSRWLAGVMGLLILRCRDQDPGGPPVIPRTLGSSLEFVRLKSHISSLRFAEDREGDRILRPAPRRPSGSSAVDQEQFASVAS